MQYFLQQSLYCEDEVLFLIVDERMVTYIHSLESPEKPLIEEIEQE